MSDPKKQTVAEEIRSRLLSGSLWTLLGRVALVVVGIGLNALLARLLIPTDLGGYYLMQASVTIGVALAGVGLPTVVVRRIGAALSSKETTGLARSQTLGLFRLAVVSATVAALLLSLLGPHLLRWAFSERLAEAALWGVAITTVGVLVKVTVEALRGFQLFGWVSALDGLLRSSIFAGVLCVADALDASLDLDAVLAMFLCAQTAVLVAAALRLRRELRRISAVEDTGSSLLRESIPFAFADVALAVLSQADIWIIGALSGEIDAALLGVAARLTVLVSFPLAIVSAVLPPLVARLRAQNETVQLQNMLQKTASIALVPSAAIVISYLCAGQSILSLVFGGYYGGASDFLVIIALAQLVNVWVGSCGVVMKMAGMGRAFLVMTIFWGTAAVAAAYGLGSAKGAIGVVFSFSAAKVLQNLSAMILVRRFVGVWTFARPLRLVASLIRSQPRSA